MSNRILRNGILMLFSLLLLFAASGFSAAEEAPVFGDADGDGSVTIADATTLIDYLLSGNGNGIDVDAAGCDQNSTVTISDVTALIDYLLVGSW